MQNLVDIKLTSPNNNMFSRLFNFSLHHGVAFIYFPKTLKHLRKIGWIERFTSHLNRCLSVKIKLFKSLSLSVIWRNDSGCFVKASVDALNTYPVPSTDFADINSEPTSSLHNPQFLCFSDVHVFLFFWRVVLSKYFHILALV